MKTETLWESPQETQVHPYRVLHVLDHSWPVLTGYSIRSRHLVAAQHRAGMHPYVLTSPLHQLDDQDAMHTVVDGVAHLRTQLDGRFSRRAIGRRWPILREAAVVLLLRHRILGVLDHESFDVLHAHSPALCGLAAWQAARSKNLPFVYETRGFWEDAAVDLRKTNRRSLRYAMSRRLESFVAHRAGAVVGIAQPILDDLRARRLNAEKLFHIPNGVDADKFCPRPRDAQLAGELGLGNEPVLGFIGSLLRYEGITWLVRAVAELRRRNRACKLLIVGEGEELPAITAEVRELEAGNFVRLIGRVPHDQVQRYYSVMDVLVYPRHSVRLTEMVTPLKPLEALAQGKAVLASNVGGIRELIEPEQTGVLFRPDDIHDFCYQAERLIRQENLRRELGDRARQIILREKDWKILARRYTTVYETAIRETRVASVFQDARRLA